MRTEQIGVNYEIPKAADAVTTLCYLSTQARDNMQAANPSASQTIPGKYGGVNTSRNVVPKKP